MQKRSKSMKDTAGPAGRTASIERRTNETSIGATVNLDGTGAYDISTGVGFLDHMLEQLARHGLIDITLKAEGDLHIDQHHTTEDSGIVLGQAFAEALGDKAGITRYGSCYLPMDETLTRVAVDVSGRPFPVEGGFQPVKGRRDGHGTALRVVSGLAQNAGITLHVENLYGENNHHIAETCYKRACAGVERQAVAIDPRQSGRVPSTKGQL